MSETWSADLAALHQAVKEADDGARRARAARDERIRELVAEGVMAARISEALGISKPAVAKIIRAKGE